VSDAQAPARAAARHWNVSQRAAFLASVRLFRELPEPLLHQLAAQLRPKPVERGAILFLEGEPADALNLLAAGRIKVVRETDDGREVILRVIGPGEIFGCAGGWGEPIYPATAVALTASVVLQLPAQTFQALLETQPALARAVVQELGARLREAEARIRELQTERVERRLARALLRLAQKAGVATPEGIEITLPLTRQDLAEFAGTTLSTASRTLSAWDRAGVIAARRARVIIRQPASLQALIDAPAAGADRLAESQRAPLLPPLARR
jgi:CRP-like cAMP-binding protein